MERNTLLAGVLGFAVGACAGVVTYEQRAVKQEEARQQEVKKQEEIKSKDLALMLREGKDIVGELPQGYIHGKIGGHGLEISGPLWGKGGEVGFRELYSKSTMGNIKNAYLTFLNTSSIPQEIPNIVLIATEASLAPKTIADLSTETNNREFVSRTLLRGKETYVLIVNVNNDSRWEYETKKYGEISIIDQKDDELITQLSKKLQERFGLEVLLKK